jgi:ankyrin repeat protein
MFIFAVQLLVQAGARADLYNDDLGLAPVHVACQQNRLDMLKVRR